MQPATVNLVKKIKKKWKTRDEPAEPIHGAPPPPPPPPLLAGSGIPSHRIRPPSAGADEEEVEEGAPNASATAPAVPAPPLLRGPRISTVAARILLEEATAHRIRRSRCRIGPPLPERPTRGGTRRIHRSRAASHAAGIRLATTRISPGTPGSALEVSARGRCPCEAAPPRRCAAPAGEGRGHRRCWGGEGRGFGGGGGDGRRKERRRGVGRRTREVSARERSAPGREECG